VLNDRLRERAKFFEAAQDHLGRALLLTTRRALRPWLFWRWVVLEYRPRPGRTLVGVLAGFVLVQASLLAVIGAVVVLQWLVDAVSGHGQRWNPYVMNTWWWQVVRFAMPWEFAYAHYDTTGPLLSLGLMVQAVMPSTFVLLPWTLRRAKVRSGHLVRVGLWSFVGVPMVLGLVELLIFGLDLTNWVFSYITPRRSPFVFTRAEEIIGALLSPLLTELDRVFPTALLAWTVLWWGFAAGRYLKLPRPWLLAGVMGALAVLEAMVLGFLIPEVRYAVGLRGWS
jgi:hypothetical protein